LKSKNEFSTYQVHGSLLLIKEYLNTAGSLISADELKKSIIRFDVSDVMIYVV